MATNVFAAMQRERCTLLPGMGPRIDFTSSETFVFSPPFRAVSFIVCAVCLFASLNLAVSVQSL